MRVALAFALVAAACGLSVQGEDPAVVGPAVDAGPSGSSSTSSSGAASSSSGTVTDAGPDVYVPPVASCASVSADTTAVVCLDFDDDPKYDNTSNRGFDDLNYDGPVSFRPAVSLEDSPLGPTAKKSLAVRFTGTGDAPVKRELEALSTFPDFGAGLYKHVSLDVDVVIDAIGDYAVVAGLHFAGTGSCLEFAGVAVNAKAEILHWQYPGTAQNVIGTYVLGQPFHVHVEADPGGGAKPLSVSINGGPVDSFPASITYPDCDYGVGFVGNYFASQGPKETFGFRFDQFVLRGTK